MTQFRGVSTKTNQQVFGFFCLVKTLSDIIRFRIMWQDEACFWHEEYIFPNSLAQFTGYKDSKGIDIYGSIPLATLFPINGEEISKGGDVITHADYGWEGDVYFDQPTGRWLIKYKNGGRTAPLSDRYEYITVSGTQYKPI